MRAWIWLVPVSLGIALASPASRAGEGPAKGNIAVVAEAPVALGSTLTAEFSGATVGDVFRLLEQALRGKVQFVVNAGARDVALPGVKLKDTNALGVMNLIAHFVPDLRIRVGIGSQFEPLQSTVDRVSQESLTEVFKDTPGTQVVLVDLAVQDDSGEAIPRKLRIYRLADVKTIVDGGMTVDDLATAIESVWEVEPIPHVATLKFHKETNLLICFGTPKHLALVDQVIEGVSGRVLEATKSERIADLETSCEGLVRQLREAQAALSHQAQALAGLQKQMTDLLAKQAVPPAGSPK